MFAVAYLDDAEPQSADLVDAFATDADRRAAGRFRAPSRRRQSLMAYALLRATLERETGRSGSAWRFAREASGKPMVLSADGAGPIAVSLAHSRGMAACAITDDGSVGIDVEFCAQDRPLTAIASTAFGTAERHAVEAGGAATFYRIWTLREALAKATANGFSMLIDRKDYFPDAPPGAAWRAAIGGRNGLFAHCVLPGSYALAVAAFAAQEFAGLPASAGFCRPASTLEIPCKTP